MSELFLNVSATSFFLLLFMLVIAALFVDKHDLIHKEWEEQPKHTRVIGLCFTILFMSTFTSLIGALIAKVWGY